MLNSEKRATAGAGYTGGAAGKARAAAKSLSDCHNSTSRKGRQGPRYGRVRGDTWHKSARGSVHILKVPRSWALDLVDVDAAEALGVTVVNVHDLEALRHFWATVETIRARGFVFDRGFGKQIGLALEHWQPTRQEAETLSEPEAEDGGPTVVQLGLFGQRVA